VSHLWNGFGRAIYFIFFPLLFIYFRLNARTRVVIKKGKKALLVKPWIGNGSWDLPGGGLHIRETEIDGAIREVLEETGMELDPNELKPLGDIRGKGFLPFSLHCFSAEITSETAIKKQFVEIIDIRWIEISALRDYRLGSMAKLCLDLWKANS